MLLNALKIGDILSIGGLTTLIGMGTTFLILVLLVLSLNVMDKSMKLKFPNKLKNQSEVMKDSALTQNVQDINQNNQVKDNNKVIAAIMAAISVVMQQDNTQQNKSKASFVVKSIKRI